MEKQNFARELANRPTLYGLRKFTTDREEGLTVQDTILKGAPSPIEVSETMLTWRGWFVHHHRHHSSINIRKSSKFKKIEWWADQFQYMNTEETHTFNKPDGNVHWKEVWEYRKFHKEELGKPFKMYTSGLQVPWNCWAFKLAWAQSNYNIFQARQNTKQLTGYCWFFPEEGNLRFTVNLTKAWLIKIDVSKKFRFINHGGSLQFIRM